MPDRRSLRNGAVLVTGATSGIGSALARRFGDAETLIVTGRQPAKGVENIPDRAHYLVIDQSEPLDAANALVAALGARGVDRLDLAFLNAGTGYFSDPQDETADEIRHTLDVNLAGTLALSHALFPMLERVGGRLVLVGSVARNGNSRLATYAASKAGLDGFGRAMIEEWRERVAVTVVHPGPTRTGMHEKAGFVPGRLARFFLSPDVMAAMIDRAAQGRSGVRVLSYAAFALNGRWLGSPTDANRAG